MLTIVICISATACETNQPDASVTETPTANTSVITNPPTSSSSSTLATDPPPTPSSPTQPTEQPPTEQDPNALTENEIAELQNLYEAPLSPSVASFYNIALGQTYSDPREINLYSFFYNGDFTEWNMTDAEDEFIKSAIRDAEYMDQFRATPENMDDILQMCFGLSLQDMQGNGLDRFVYFKETSCYYNATTSPPSHAEFLEITGGSHVENGNLQVFYTANNKNQYVMILKPVDGGYHILSNLEVEE